MGQLVQKVACAFNNFVLYNPKKKWLQCFLMILPSPIRAHILVHTVSSVSTALCALSPFACFLLYGVNLIVSLAWLHAAALLPWPQAIVWRGRSIQLAHLEKAVGLVGYRFFSAKILTEIYKSYSRVLTLLIAII